MSNETTILVVDDDRTIVEVLQGYLQQAGYRVQVAYNGDTAVHLLRNENPNLLLLDLMLPDKDGWDIARWIRSDARLSAMPIIMLTARVEDMDKIIGLELGADDYITKPFNGREVVARVRALQAMMEAPNHTFTREELLEKGMGYAYEGMGRALDTHIKNLRQKIEEDPKNPEYIQTVYSVGYRLVSL
jgi:two-component system alkaline phosphatase synthesis response regulator PhoP